jgi:hypothetical protein
MNKFNKWLRSKTGLYTIIGITCMPSCSETDDRFLAVANTGEATFAGETLVFWISVPGNQADFNLAIFDGDSGKDANGDLNKSNGHWDLTTVESIYTLYADPLKDGTGQTVLNTWHGNQDNMPDNSWFEVTIPNTDAAKAPSGHYFYRLEISQEIQSVGENQFKLRSTGYLSAGQANKGGSAFGVVADVATLSDVKIVFPQFQSVSNMGPSIVLGWRLRSWHVG